MIPSCPAQVRNIGDGSASRNFETSAARENNTPARMAPNSGCREVHPPRLFAHTSGVARQTGSNRFALRANGSYASDAQVLRPRRSIDSVPPVTTASTLPGPNGNGWNNSNVTVTLNSTDNGSARGTGVRQITYSASGAQSIGSTVLMVRCAGKREGWVFPANSRSGHINTIDKQFRKARADADLPVGLKLYCSRHDFGTQTLQRTGNLALVMRVMGQTSTKAAMQYQHPDLEHIRMALNATRAKPEQEKRVN